MSTFRLAIDTDLELRLLEPEHAEELFALTDRNRQHLRPWLSWVDWARSADGTREFLESSLERFKSGWTLQAGLWWKGKLVGSISLDWIDSGNKSTSVSYWLDAGHQGRGIMTRSCRALVDYAFRERELNRIALLCTPENRRSRAVAERLGFKQEGVQRQAYWMYDHFEDLVLYAMLASEWSAALRQTEPQPAASPAEG